MKIIKIIKITCLILVCYFFSGCINNQITQEKTYKIIYNLDGGVCDELVTEFTEEDEVILGTPTKSGFNFEGWYCDNNKISSIPKGTKNNVVVNAKFTIIDYNISYDLKGGEVSELLVDKYNVENIPNLPSPYKAYSNFLYWLDQYGNKITTLENIYYDLQLTAIYDSSHYKVIFELGENDLICYYEKGTKLNDSVFININNYVYDIKLGLEEIVVNEEITIIPEEYIICEIEQQNSDNVIEEEFNNNHYTYINVIANSSNVVIRPYINENIVVDAIYIDNFNPCITSLVVKEGFDNRIYIDGEYPNLISIEFENGIKILGGTLLKNCPNIKVIVLPSTFEFFVISFFQYCNSLETLFIRGDGFKYSWDVYSTLYKGGPLQIYFEREVNYKFKMSLDGVVSYIPCYSNSVYEEIILSQ